MFKFGIGHLRSVQLYKLRKCWTTRFFISSSELAPPNPLSASGSFWRFWPWPYVQRMMSADYRWGASPHERVAACLGIQILGDHEELLSPHCIAVTSRYQMELAVVETQGCAPPQSPWRSALPWILVLRTSCKLSRSPFSVCGAARIAGNLLINIALVVAGGRWRCRGEVSVGPLATSLASCHWPMFCRSLT